jgi:aspartate/methionine/tyrosine aminotransferase
MGAATKFSLACRPYMAQSIRLARTANAQHHDPKALIFLKPAEAPMAQFPPNDIVSLIGAAPRHDFGGSYGPNLKLAALLDAATQSRIADMPLSYRTAQGDPELRKQIAKANDVTADDVVITVGGMHALFLLAFILCDRGDGAVTTAPVFPPTRTVLDVIGADVGVLPVSFDQHYRLNLAALSALLSKQTKLVSLASPQNPSGVAVPQQMLREVVALMQSRCPQAYLLVDDTYREAVYGDDPVAPSAIALGPKVVTVASLSKCHGAPGLRLGWAITRDRALREQLVLGKFNTVVSNSAIDEALALEIFERRDQIMSERRKFLAECLAVTERWVGAHQDFVDWVRPSAGALCCLRLNVSVFDDAAVTRFYAVLSELGVRVSHGAWFLGEAARVFRLGFGHMPIAELAIGLSALDAAFRRTLESVD